jgi:diacylglycerol kinase family enzyme
VSRALLIVNPRAGRGGPSSDEVVAEARRRGLDVHVLDGGDPAEIARGSDAEVLGIAGGDGSCASVAQVCVERDLPLVCVPFGTHNHFARDAGLDRDDLIAALDLFADGSERRVDVGLVQGRVFLNNVSLGLYARLVHHREARRRRREALARLRAFALLAVDREPLGLSIDGEPVTARIVLVSNNAYALDVLSIGERERLDEGLLHVYVPSGLVPRDWHDRTSTELEIRAARPSLRVAIDGEPAELEPPIRFEIQPGALRLRAGPE